MSGEVFHITLVHGTFARDSAWTRQDSLLCKYLKAHLRGQVEFHRFIWSGWPCQRARSKATHQLRAEVSGRIKDDPEARHCIIAHSHGGNVACYALNDTELAAKLHCLVTLATPFLVTRKRHLSRFGTFSAFASLVSALLVVWVIIPLPWMGVSSVGDYFRLYHRVWSLDYWVTVLPLLGIMVLLAAFLFRLGRALSELISRWQDWLIPTLKLPDLARDRLLVVRGPADEANALLAAMQVLEIVIAALWEKRGVLDRLRNWLTPPSKSAAPVLDLLGCWPVSQSKSATLGAPAESASWVNRHEKLIQRWLWLGSVCVGVIGGAFLYVPALWDTIPDPQAFFQPRAASSLVLWACLILIVAVIVTPFLLFLGVWGLVFGVALVIGVTIGLVVDAAVIVLALIMLFVVPELGPLALITAVSAEASPPGTYPVLQLTTEGYDGADRALLHSMTYDHPEAHSAIVEMLTREREQIRP